MIEEPTHAIEHMVFWNHIVCTKPTNVNSPEKKNLIIKAVLISNISRLNCFVILNIEYFVQLNFSHATLSSIYSIIHTICLAIASCLLNSSVKFK